MSVVTTFTDAGAIVPFSQNFLADSAESNWSESPREGRLSVRRHTTIDGITYKVADHRAEREAASRLVHTAYVEAGLIDPSPLGMRLTRYHLEPTTTVFVAKHHDRVISTMSLVADGQLGVPMEAIYADEIETLRAAGARLAEVSCLAQDRDYFEQGRMFEIYLQLVGLMFQAARHQSLDQLVIAVHPRHAKFYRRMLGFEAIGEQRSYGCVRDNPAIACRHDFASLDQTPYRLHGQVYAVQFDEWELQQPPMSRAERVYLGSLLDASEARLPQMVA